MLDPVIVDLAKMVFTHAEQGSQLWRASNGVVFMREQFSQVNDQHVTGVQPMTTNVLTSVGLLFSVSRDSMAVPL